MLKVRADAIVDVVDFLGEHMNKHKNVEWQVVDKAIDTWYCGIGVKKGNASLQQWLNVALYTLHRAGFRRSNLGKMVRNTSNSQR